VKLLHGVVVHGKVDSSLSYYSAIFVVLILIITIFNKKDKLSLCLVNQALCHEDIRRSVGIASLILTSALDGVEGSDSRLGRFNTGEIIPGAH
jgi:hypothetical protein